MQFRSAAVLAVLAALVCAAPAAATRYVAVPIGPHGFGSGPWGINQAGDVAGQLPNDDFGWKPFVWAGGTVTPIPTAATDQQGLAWDVNASGWAVGQTYNGDTGWYGWLYRNGTLERMPGIAEDLNDRGQVVGMSFATGEGYIWQDGATTDLPGTSTADSINERGEVAGVNGDNRSFFLRDPDGTMHSIPNLDGAYGGTPWDLNEAGTFVGESYGNGTRGVVGTVAGLTELTSPDGDPYNSPHPWGINNAGAIVGDAGAYGAWLLEPAGTMQNLNDLLIPANGVTSVSGAYDINDKGQIAVIADGPEGQVTARLDPAPPLELEAAPADPAAEPGADVAYSVTIDNPVPSDVTVSTLSATLPEGFDYVAGSTAGAFAADPAVNGRVATWSGTVQVPANGKATLTFKAVAAQTDGDYSLALDAAAGPFEVKRNLQAATVSVAKKRVPLIFIPGITGSYLENGDGEAWPHEEALVRSLDDHFLDSIALQPDGVHDANGPVWVMTEQGHDGVIGTMKLCADLSIGFPGVTTIPIAHPCKGVGPVYTPTMDALKQLGYEKGKTLFPFAFDWRKSATSNGAALLAFIDAVRKQTGAKKVDIMAHSQGGLVAEAALQSPASDGKVRRVVSLATPFLGTPKALGVLEFRQPCLQQRIICIINQAEAQKLVTNMPGFLGLLPSAAFYRAASNPTVVSYGVPLTAGQVRARLADRNLPLIDAESGWHAGVDAFSTRDSKVEWRRFVSSGRKTPRTFDESRVRYCVGVRVPVCGWKTKVVVRPGNGDGTVLTISAAEQNCSKGYDSQGSASTVYLGGYEHLGLVQDPHVVAVAVSFLRNGGGAPRHCGVLAFARRAKASAAADPEPTPADVSDVPAPLGGIDIQANGALTGLVTDAEGYALGTIDPGLGITTEAMPGGMFAPGVDAATYGLDDPGLYDARWTTTDDGDVSFAIHEYANDDVAATRTTPPLFLPQGATVALSVSEPVGPSQPTLQVDVDGDGKVDRAIAFGPPVTGAAAQDAEPPTSTVSVRRSGERRVRVTVGAADTGGSGVATIQYTLTATGKQGVYTGPLELPAQGEILVRAVDAAGNVQADYAVGVLDDAPSLPDFVTAFPPLELRVSGSIDYRGDVDCFGFATTGGRVRVKVGGDSRTDVQLLDADGQPVSGVTRRGDDDEASLEATLPAGRYVVRVAAAAGRRSDERSEYKLSVRSYSR